jgi:hypothetical protein
VENRLTKADANTFAAKISFPARAEIAFKTIGDATEPQVKKTPSK